MAGETKDSYVLKRAEALTAVQPQMQLQGRYQVIGDSAFRNNIRLRSIHMTGIREIGSQAFDGCCALKEVGLSGVQMIGARAFAGCSNLTGEAENGISFSDRLGKLGEEAFWRCKRLRSVRFLNNRQLHVIPDGAFAECRGLRTMQLPEGLTAIGNQAFLKCESLRELHLPDTLEEIGDKAFYQCGLEEILLPESLRRIGESAFLKCRNLTGIRVPDRVHTIGKWAFHGCAELKYVEFHHDPEEVGPWITNRNCIIRCKKGSRMEAYAKEYEIAVEYLGDHTKLY